MPKNITSGANPVSTCATTLHVTLLTSHYNSAHDKEDATTAFGNSSGAAGHRRDAPVGARANSSANVKSAGSEGAEVYSCSTVADHLDTVARVLCAVLRLQNTANDDAVAETARRIQTAKAVRDGVMPWENVADAASLEQQQDSHLPGYVPPFEENAKGGNLDLPFVSAATTPSSRATTPPSTSSGTTKGKGRIPSAAKGGPTASLPQHSGAMQTALSANSTPSSLSLLGLQDHTSEPVPDPRQRYVDRELPPCEMAVVPGASSASAESYVLFVYHLAHAEEVLAQLSALATEEISSGSDKKDTLASSIIDLPKGEKRSPHSVRAAEIITEALWATVQGALGTHLHVSGCRTAPTHVPVVWAMADPRWLKAFLPCSSDETDELFSFHPCPTSFPVRSSPLCRPVVMTSTERLVRLLPRSIFYLYDPSSSSTVVKETLAVLQSSSGERSHSPESSQSAVPGLGVSEGIRKVSLPRNGARPPTMPAAKSSRSAGLSTSGSGASRGRSGRGAAGAAAATATHASVLAASAPQQSSLQSRLLNMGVDMQAAPEDFPYCNSSPRILAQYLYSGGVAAAPPLSQVAAPVASSPTQADLEAELTCFLAKMAAFQRAVMAASEAAVTTSKTEEATEEMWCIHASLLRWVRAYLNSPPDVPLADRAAAGRLMSGTDGDTQERRQQPPPAFEEVVRLSLSKCLPKDSVWPLPLWEVAPLPIAPVPPLVLRSTGSSDIAASTNRTVENIMPWATTVLSTMVGEDQSGDAAEVHNKSPFVPLLSRLVHLIEAYNAWSSKNSLTPARIVNSACHKGAYQAVAGKAQGGQTEDAQSMVPPSMAPGRHTGGVFNVMSAVCVWVAAVGASPAPLKPSGELTTLCASELWVPSNKAKQPDCSLDAMASPSPASSGLFRRYAQPFYALQMVASRDEKTRIGAGALVAIVPRLATATEAPESESADTDKRIKYAVPTAERIHHDGADVAPSPYPQEASWMVRHIIAKNAGHFEVNLARGTDTITPAADRKGLCPTLQDLAAGGSPSIALHQSAIAAMTTTTKSIGHLLHQQRRRLLRHMSGVAAKLQPYSQGVHLIKEMARDFLGRRPVMEASVTLQEALESTLAAPRTKAAADRKCSESLWTLSRRGTKDSRGESADSGANATQQVSALNLLQRYLVSVDPTHARLATKSKLVKPQSPALLLERHRSNESNDNRLLAARAAAENLMPRIYEHVLQQALLHQLLREMGLELAARPASPPNSGHLLTAPTEDDASANDDWNITQQLPVQAIVTSILDFQERFGAHNVAWRSCALHYRPLSLPTAKKDSFTGQDVNVREIPEEDTDDGVLRTSAYAHNALNVHPTRRVTHIWIAGVTVPSAPVAQNSEGGCESNPGMKQGQSKHVTLGPQRSRRWVNMVPQAGTVTPVEVYALWQSLLREQLDNLARMSNEKCTVTTVADSAAHLRVGPTDLKLRTMYSLISQYMQEHAEASTSLVRTKETSSTSSEKMNITDISPMRFDTHETIYPYGDAIVEVWSSEVQRLCRYIKATEVIATLHATPSNKGDPNVHLTVHWDDGLLLTCTSGSASQNNIDMVPPIDVMLTTSNTVFQRREGVSRIRLYRFPNTSSSTMASTAVSLKAMSGPPTPTVPQGGVMETCTALFEEPVILYCVHHCPPKMTAATVVELEGSSEHETMCEVDERTGVVHRFYASGMQQLLFPSGAIMIRRPVVAAFSKLSLCKPTPHYCDTLVTLDGRCFVRNDSVREDNFADASHKQSKGVHGDVFHCVQARISRANCGYTQRAAEGDDPHAPPFTRTECTYDAVYHCHMRSRQDGLTVAEYESLKSYTGSEGPNYGDRACTMLARVVVFPDGTTITTVAPREVRRRALVRHPDGTSVLASLSSSTLCTLLEEVQAVEDSLLRSVGDRAELSVCWCVEASSMPRVYLAPAQQESNKKEKVRIPSFAVVFGDGTVLQRRWVAAVLPPSPFCATADEGSALVGTDKDDGAGGGDVGGMDMRDTPPYSAGTFETVLTRPSTSAVRILHQHAIATIEPADVLDAITYTSPAAYAVGQGLLFFDLACGGGLRLVDAARCVWEVRELAAAHGPQVLHPDRASTYGELLRALVSPHYSPHRLPRAVQMMYAREQQHESATYVQKRATGWCPPLLRRMREIAEPFIRIAQLLRTDVLAPIESSAAAADKRLFPSGGALSTPPSASTTGGSCTKVQGDSFLAGVPPESMLRVFPVCFGQLDNGEAIRYRHVCEVPPLSSGSGESSTPIALSEPQVIERLVPGIETGSVLGYISTTLGHTYDADTIGSLFSGQPNTTTGNSGVLWKRLMKAARLSLLCAGVLAPAIPPAIKPPSRASFLSTAPSSVADINASSVLSLPPLAVLLNRGSRWLPAALQPPQRFGTYQIKRSADNFAAEVDNADVAWVRDSPASLSNATLNAAYVEYVLQQVNPATAIKTSCAALQREVVRKELHRHEQLAQLSHYHRVLSSQWPMELPASAREEQVRLERRFEELQRTPSSGIPSTNERMAM